MENITKVPLIELLHIAAVVKNENRELFNAIVRCITEKRRDLYKGSASSEINSNTSSDPQIDPLHVEARNAIEKGMSALNLTSFSIEPIILEVAAIYVKQKKESCYIRDDDFRDLPSFELKVLPPKESEELPQFVFQTEFLGRYTYTLTNVFPSRLTLDNETVSLFEKLSMVPKSQFSVKDSINLEISGLPKDVLSRLKENNKKIFEVFSLEKTNNGTKEHYLPKSNAEVEKTQAFSLMLGKSRVIYRYLPHSEVTLESVQDEKAVFSFKAEQAFSLATESENKTYLVIRSMNYSINFSYPYPFAILVEKPKITGENSTSATHWVGTNAFYSADRALRETKVTLPDDVLRELIRDYAWLTMEPIENIVQLDCI